VAPSWSRQIAGNGIEIGQSSADGLRKEDLSTWDPVRDALRDEHPTPTPEQRASLMTMDVVLEEGREFRPIWEATDGRFGNVSLQVNPRANDDAGRMAEEVTGLCDRPQIDLDGTPNALCSRFLLPAPGWTPSAA